jgi:hypothetical protein
MLKDIYKTGMELTQGKTWYVDSNLSSSGTGMSWDTAFITLAEAITAAGNYDTIYIRRASIQTIATTGIEITQEGLRIFGENYSPGSQNAALKIAGGTASMFTISANRVEIAGLCLSQRTAYPCIKIGSDAQSTAGTAIYQTYIHDCNIEGYGTGTYGIAPNMSATTVDCVNLVVEDNYFNSFATAAIYASGTRKTIRRNTICIAADTTGIHMLDNAGDRAYTIIVDNYIFGVAGTGTTKGIYFAGTPTAGTLLLAKNYLGGTFDVTITDVGAGVENYVTNATGGVLINC